MHIERLHPSHLSAVREVYKDAVQSLGPDLYTRQQIEAWSAIASLPGVLDKTLNEGKGWVSIANNELQAFAVRSPENRLALLYCRASSSRQGHASKLLRLIEEDAISEQQKVLFAEASAFSYQLLLRKGWQLITQETINISGVTFNRYCMKKVLID